MFSVLSRRLGLFLPVLLGLVAWSASPVQAQEPEIAFNQVMVSDSEATLRLEFSDGSTFEVRLSGGQIRVDDTTVGSYEEGGSLERSWRALLGSAISADNGEIAGLLSDWRTPSGEVGSPDAEAAASLRNRIGQALLDAGPDTPREPRVLDAGTATFDEVGEFLAALSGQEDRFILVSRGLADMRRSGLQFYLDEDAAIAVDTELRGNLVVVGGSLTIDGRLDGDALLVDGQLSLGEEGRVDGTVLHGNSEVPDEATAIRDGLVEVQGLAASAHPPEPPTPAASPTPQADQQRGFVRTTVRNVSSGLGGILRIGVWFLILLGIGAATLYFAPRNLDVIARTASASPGRSALVGLAALFLTLPAYIVGILVLTVTVIGILALPVWAIAFPLVTVVVSVVGVVAVAWNIGALYASKQKFDRGPGERPISEIARGLVLLLSAFAISQILGMAGALLSFLAGLFIAVGVVVLGIATVVGTGAVLLSWGGRDDAYSRVEMRSDPETDRGGAGAFYSAEGMR